MHSIYGICIRWINAQDLLLIIFRIIKSMSFPSHNAEAENEELHFDTRSLSSTSSFDLQDVIDDDVAAHLSDMSFSETDDSPVHVIIEDYGSLVTVVTTSMETDQDVRDQDVTEDIQDVYSDHNVREDIQDEYSDQDVIEDIQDVYSDHDVREDIQDRYSDHDVREDFQDGDSDHDVREDFQDGDSDHAVREDFHDGDSDHAVREDFQDGDSDNDVREDFHDVDSDNDVREGFQNVYNDQYVREGFQNGYSNQDVREGFQNGYSNLDVNRIEDIEHTPPIVSPLQGSHQRITDNRYIDDIPPVWDMQENIENIPPVWNMPVASHRLENDIRDNRYIVDNIRPVWEMQDDFEDVPPAAPLRRENAEEIRVNHYDQPLDIIPPVWAMQENIDPLASYMQPIPQEEFMEMDLFRS